MTTLTFTPAMFHASLQGMKNTTRRLITATCFRSADGRVKFLGDEHTQKHPAHTVDQIKPMVTSWRVNGSFDNCKPTALDAKSVLETGGIYWEHTGFVHELTARKTSAEWYDTPTHAIDPSGFSHESKLYPGRFLPKVLYPLAPQIEILSVSAEFLHDITEESALRDGIQPIGTLYGVANELGDFIHQSHTARESYFKLWDSINAQKNGGKYAAAQNPACWVITYRLLNQRGSFPA